MVVLGASGTGKSWYVGKKVEEVAPKFDFVIMFDIEREEIGLSASPNPLLRRVVVDEDRLEALNFARVIYRNRQVRVVPDDLTVEEQRELYGRLCRVAMYLAKEENAGSVWVVCDEAHNVVPQEAGNNLDQRIERLITGGRKHGAEVCHVSQRPQLLHKTALSQVDKAAYFRISGGNDIDKINKQSEIDATKLKGLTERQVIVENRDTGESKKLDTNNMSRSRPHYSGDDGILDDAFPV